MSSAGATSSRTSPASAVLGAGLGNLFYSAPLPFRISIPAVLIWTAVVILGAVLATEAAATRASRLTVRGAPRLHLRHVEVIGDSRADGQACAFPASSASTTFGYASDKQQRHDLHHSRMPLSITGSSLETVCA